MNASDRAIQAVFHSYYTNPRREIVEGHVERIDAARREVTAQSSRLTQLWLERFEKLDADGHRSVGDSLRELGAARDLADERLFYLRRHLAGLPEAP